MTLKRTALAAVAGTALLAAAPAFADSPHWRHGHGWQARHQQQHQHRFHHHAYRPAVIRPVIRPAPVYYYAPPRPVVVYPQPVYVEPRPVVVYRQPGFSVSFGF